jgi:hypothetical protein
MGLQVGRVTGCRLQGYRLQVTGLQVGRVTGYRVDPKKQNESLFKKGTKKTPDF